jgi:hypothetical protein
MPKPGAYPNQSEESSRDLRDCYRLLIGEWLVYLLQWLRRNVDAQ